MRKTALLVAVGVWAAAAMPAQTLRLARAIELPGVEGRIDHMAFDAARQRLFVAALGNNTVEVIDVNAGREVKSLVGFSEPQGMVYLAEFNRLYVANGGDGTLRVVDATTLATMATVKFDDDDADNVRYDAASKLVYVGYGSGELGIVDPGTNALLGTIPLPGHPESFQLEQRSSRIFVNVPGAHEVAVVDRTAKTKTGSWSPGLATGNFPMALDEANRRAFVGCRWPARLLVFDTATGREVARLDLHGDCDDLFFDARRKLIYASCGAGFIDIFEQVGSDEYRLKEAVATVAKARTCLFAGDRLYLAVPRRGNEPALVRVYDIVPAGERTK